MTEGNELEDYEKRVQSATDALDTFAGQLFEELDVVNGGGFRWWKGYCDWRRLALLADYLIASIQGASSALMAASLAADEVRTGAAADSDAMQQAMERMRSSTAKPSHHDFAAALPRDAVARRRTRTIAFSIEHCLFHLGQALDRLAAAIILVGGFGIEDVFLAQWTWIIGLSKDLSGQSAPTKAQRKAKKSPIITIERVQETGTAGRDAQEKLFAPINRAADYGPTEWLEWMRDTRNATTHRPPVKGLDMVTRDGAVRVLFRHPKWSEVQAFAFGRASAGDDPMAAVVLVKSVSDIVDGLCDSMNTYVSAITDAMLACWNTRKESPGMIIQYPSQWQSPRPVEPPSNFPGYGEANLLAAQSNLVITHPNEARRWQAARVMDHCRHEWWVD